MRPFSYTTASDVASAVRDAKSAGTKFLGGGTNLVDLMREGIEKPDTLVDVSGLSTTIADGENGQLIIGAGAKNTQVASHPAVRSRFPLLSMAILNGATGQIRNMATVGGNILQRTRCLYFYDHPSRCNKREPGSGCDAIDGHNRMSAVLGASEHCVATHPSDMCVALAALGATIVVTGPEGKRAIDLVDFHRLPGSTPAVETELAEGELITQIVLDPQPDGARCEYCKVRDRASYAFALVSAGIVLKCDAGTVRHVRIALGGVAPKPWRAYEAERVLEGNAVSHGLFEKAADAITAEARPLSQNGFKLDMTKRVVVSTLSRLAGLEKQA